MLAPLALFGLVPGAVLGAAGVTLVGIVAVGMSLARNRGARLGSRLG
jgi:hypothetical protein